jgi:hypothetical protein
MKVVPNIAAEWKARHIRGGVPDSNLGPKTGYFA